jgi:hypothetical protein
MVPQLRWRMDQALFSLSGFDNRHIGFNTRADVMKWVV